jgi:hypothetical protein
MRPPVQFVDCFEQYLVSDDTWALIERLLLERLSLRGLCRTVGVGLKWLLGFLVTCFEDLPEHLNGRPITGNTDVMIQPLEVEADELVSFVQKKTNKQWIWLLVMLAIAAVKGLGSGGARFPRRIVDTPLFTRINRWCTNSELAGFETRSARRGMK